MAAREVNAFTLVVAIDGPSGSGKSTVARGVAQALGLRYLDTGAMYRALTWWVMRTGVDPEDARAVAATLPTFTLEISTDPTLQSVSVAGHDVTAAIRAAEVTAAVSAVSAVPAVRAELVALQRGLVRQGGIVVEGRDIGSTVCPGAPVKIFLTAHADTRASRRASEVAASGAAPSAVRVEEVRADLDRRDRLDAGRQASPLQQAVGAVVLDSTTMDVAEVIAAVLALVRNRTGVAPAVVPAATCPAGGDS